MIISQFRHCDGEIWEWHNFGISFKLPYIMQIHAWCFMHCRNHQRHRHTKYILINSKLFYKSIVRMRTVDSWQKYCENVYGKRASKYNDDCCAYKSFIHLALKESGRSWSIIVMMEADGMDWYKNSTIKLDPIWLPMELWLDGIFHLSHFIR